VRCCDSRVAFANRLTPHSMHINHWPKFRTWCPKGVICLASALAFQGLTDQIPPKVWIAIGRKDWRPRLTYPPVRNARFSDENNRCALQRD
jgi:hypothetical protein